MIGDQAHPEVLDRGGREWFPSSSRARLLLVVGLVCLALAGWFVDRQVQARERASLDACADATSRAGAVADRRLSSMATYIAPALATVPPGAGRDRYYLMVAEMAESSRVGVEAARDLCASSSVLWVHQELRARRSALLSLLDTRRELLRGIALDGRRYYEETPELTALERRAFPR